MDIILDYLKDFWGVIIGFLILGGQWYWNNKKTKNQQKTETINNELIEQEKDSKEIQNMKDILNIFQENFKKELLEKNETINNLSIIISQLNSKIDKLSKDIKLLNAKLDDNNETIIKIANNCKNKRKTEDVCLVLEHVNSKKIKE